MQLILKKYSWWFDFTSPTGQFFIESKVELTYELTNFDNARFLLPIEFGLREDDFIEICEVTDVDTCIFRWFVERYEPTYTNVPRQQVPRTFAQYVVFSEKALLQKRKLLRDVTFSSDTLSAIVTDIIWDYNTRWDNRTVSSTISWTTNLDSKIWDSYYNIIQEIVDEKSWFWDVVNGEIRMRTQLGVDRTSGAWFVEFLYNQKFPSTNTVSEFRVVGQSTRANIIIGKDKSWSTYIAEDNSFGKVLWVLKFDFRDWDLQEKTEQKLQEKIAQQRIFKFNVEVWSVEADVWDIVKLSIEDTDPEINWQSDAIILKKKVTYDNWWKFVEFVIADKVIEERTDSEIIIRLIKNVDLQSL